jgi:malonyl-CoA O-methyltransferase
MKLPSFLQARKLPPVPELNEALRRQIRRSFDRSAEDNEHFPATIDPRIQHVQVLLSFFSPVGAKKLLDVGCGKGRYARIFLEQNPSARISGLDISGQMLAAVPEGINRISAIMTEIPFADGSFDGVYATESLEHAVDIERAIAEMCRVLRPGGKLAIIDKNAEHWGKLKTPAWERWFHRREIEKLLGRYCRNVTSRPISYWEDVSPDGLFLAWFAEK